MQQILKQTCQILLQRHLIQLPTEGNESKCKRDEKWIAKMMNSTAKVPNFTANGMKLANEMKSTVKVTNSIAKICSILHTFLLKLKPTIILLRYLHHTAQ